MKSKLIIFLEIILLIILTSGFISLFYFFWSNKAILIVSVILYYNLIALTVVNVFDFLNEVRENIKKEVVEKERIEDERKRLQEQHNKTEKEKIFYLTAKDLYIKKDYTNSINYFNRAISLNSNKANYYNDRGNTFATINEIEKALEDYNKAIELDPISIIFIESRALLFEKKGENEKAINEWKNSAELGSEIAKNKLIKIENERIAKIQDDLKKELLISKQEKTAKRVENAERSSYADMINATSNISFEKICRFSVEEVNHWNKIRVQQVKTEINNGEGKLDTDDQLMYYIHALRNMHIAKLKCAFDSLDLNKFSLINNYFDNENIVFDLFDWGAGQAFASSVFVDYLMSKKIVLNLNKFVFIEPSVKAIKRGVTHLNKLIEQTSYNPNIKIITQKLNDVQVDDIYSLNSNVKIHLFSNILDIDDYDQNQLIDIIKKTQKGINYFICVSPYEKEDKADRVDSFKRYFKTNYDTTFQSLSEENNSKGFLKNDYWCCNNKYNGNYNGRYCTRPHIGNGCGERWTRVIRVFKVYIN